jgi:tripartite-type tricarboxylate transporter receptor subunit TctC
LLGLWLAIASTGCGPLVDSSDKFPQRPIKVIVPFAAGGGSDTFGRLIQAAIDDHDLLPQRLAIINVPGAGGTIGSRRVKNARPDGHTILLLHEGILTAQHSGQAAYGPAAFEPIAGTGNAPQIIAVAQQSPLQDLNAVLARASGRPNELVYAANIGAPSHFAGLMLEQQQLGATFRYAQYGGGAKRFAAIKGGHVDISSFSLAEYAQYRSAGLRALAVLAPERHPEFPELPTAREQGFDVVSANMQFWWAPHGTPSERLRIIADAIEQAMRLPDVRDQLTLLRIDPVMLRDDDLSEEIDHRSRTIAAVSQRKINGLPNFPLITLCATVALGIGTCVLSCRRRDRVITVPAHQRTVLPAIAVAVATVLYIAALQFGHVPFVAATVLYVMLVGILIAAGTESRRTQRAVRFLPVLAVVAVTLSVGIDYVFTSILVVDLP